MPVPGYELDLRNVYGYITAVIHTTDDESLKIYYSSVDYTRHHLFRRLEMRDPYRTYRIDREA